MTRDEMIDLVQFISVICPQQKIDRATAIPWYEVIGDLDFGDARNAVIAVKHYQAFVDTSDIIREVKRAASAKPYERTVRQALEESNLRQLEPAAAPPHRNYLGAKATFDARMRDEAVRAFAAEREPALTVACPWCQAGAGNRCRNVGTGRDAAASHVARIGAARARDQATVP